LDISPPTLVPDILNYIDTAVAHSMLGSSAAGYIQCPFSITQGSSGRQHLRLGRNLIQSFDLILPLAGLPFADEHHPITQINAAIRRTKSEARPNTASIEARVMLEQGEINFHVVGDRSGEPRSVLIAQVVWLALERESRERVRHLRTSLLAKRRPSEKTKTRWTNSYSISISEELSPTGPQGSQGPAKDLTSLSG
jgi:hypothetical protein